MVKSGRRVFGGTMVDGDMVQYYFVSECVCQRTSREYEYTFPTTQPLPNIAPTSTTVPSPTSAASTTALASTTTFLPSSVPSLRTFPLLRDDAMLLRLLSASRSGPRPMPTFALSYTTTPSPSTTGASALLTLLCGWSMVFGPSVMGCVPVICACWAMSTVGSRAIEDGFGSIETRLGAVEERRSGPERAAEGCADMVAQFERLRCQTLMVWETRHLGRCALSRTLPRRQST
jgi:hypothetical protein